MKSNKQVALIVKEDGLIYVNEVPEEPIMGICSTEPRWNCYQLPGCLCAREWNPYRAALASAKESAVLVSNHNQAFFIIQDHFMPKGAKEFKLVPGIYPIPDLQWEVEDVPIERDPSTFTYYEREAGRQLVTEFTKVAILL